MRQVARIAHSTRDIKKGLVCVRFLPEIPLDRVFTPYGLYEEMYSSSIPSARLLTGILNHSLIQAIHPS